MLKNILIISALLVAAAPASAGYTEYVSPMELYVEKNGAPFIAEIQPEGYSAQIAATVGTFSEEVQMRVDEINKERREQWNDYVMNSGEFDHLDEEAKQYLIDNASEEWGSPEPLRYEGTYIVYKNSKRIGYVINFADMVDSAIIQDGSGWSFFLDLDENLILADDWQS